MADIHLNMADIHPNSGHGEGESVHVHVHHKPKPAKVEGKTPAQSEKEQEPEAKDFSEMDLEPGKYSREEIEAVFANLREQQVRAMEKELENAGGGHQQREDGKGNGDSSTTTMPKILDSEAVAAAHDALFEECAREPRTDSDDEGEGVSTKISYQRFKFENGVMKESGCTTTTTERLRLRLPERFRLAYLPWVADTDSDNLNAGAAALARVDQVVTLKKRISENQEMIFAGWIKIHNKSLDHYVSYNVNEFDPNIFMIRSPVGILSPNESRDVLIKTTDAFPFRMIDLVYESFAVHIAPCKIIDLYAKLGIQSTPARAPAGNGGGRAAQAQRAGDYQFHTSTSPQLQLSDKDEDKLFAEKITDPHILDFWRSYKSIWFPQAQIFRVTEFRPRKPSWLKEPSLVNGRNLHPSAFVARLASSLCQAIKRRGEQSKTSHAHQMEATKREKYSYVIFGHQSQDTSANPIRWIFKHAALEACVIVCLLLFLFPDYFPALSLGSLAEQSGQNNSTDTNMAMANTSNGSGGWFNWIPGLGN